MNRNNSQGNNQGNSQGNNQGNSQGNNQGNSQGNNQGNSQGNNQGNNREYNRYNHEARRSRPSDYHDMITKYWPRLMAMFIGPGMLIVLILVMRLSSDANQYDVQVCEQYINQQVSEDGVRSLQIDLTQIEGHYDLMIRTSQQEMEVKIGEEVIYECKVTEKQYVGEMPPSQWNLIELTDAQREEVITIEYYSSYLLYEDNIPRIYYGTAEDLISYITILTFPTCVVAWLMILFGMGTIVMCYVYKHTEIFHINYIGIFLILFGMWSWGESQTRLFNYADLFLQSQVTLVMIMVIPLPLVLYLKHKVVNERISKALNIYGITCLASTIIGITLSLWEIVDLIEYTIISQIILSVGVVILVWANVSGGYVDRSDKKKMVLHRVAIVMVGISTIAECIALYNNEIKGIGKRARTGVVLYVLILFIIEILEIREKRNQSIAMEQEMQKQLEAANLHIMNDKMTPHFMHNTLLAIQELCYSDPEEAARSIGIFSKYTRINLEGIGERKLIPFKKELEYINLYMSIQLMCFEEEIRFETDLQVMEFGIPPFSIQPIVENAVVHGVRKCMRQGVIKLRTWMEKGWILIQIEDNGAGYEVSEERKKTFNSGAAVVYRIEKLLGGRIEIYSRKDQGTVVTIQIPAMKEEM